MLFKTYINKSLNSIKSHKQPKVVIQLIFKSNGD